MEFSLFQLVWAFVCSVIFGLVLGALYEPFRLVHKLGLKGNISYFICDVLYMVVFGVATYLFCLVFIEGRVRFFVILGEALGFFVYYFSVKRIIDVVIDPIIVIFKKISKKLLKKCHLLLYNIKNKILCMLKGVVLKISKVLKYEKRENKKHKARRGKVAGNRRGKKTAKKAK
ncbi:MAG: spore cortex biosynthesis protein YabQ [Ruminococcus sp.]|nr:spore cortex biosynthesis protein YabQ [Ruminococcus sp.]